MPRKEFESFTRLDASDVNTYLMDQSVMTFAGTAARGSAIGTAVEGMVTYLEDSNSLQLWDGASWTSAGGVSSGNAIINGAFEINQRGFNSSTASGTYGFDRWFLDTGDGTVTYSTQNFTPGAAPVAGYEASNFARLVSTGQTTTSASARIRQRIEDVRTFAGQTVTISFFAKASTGTPSVAVNFVQQFGSGGSSNVIINGQKLEINSSWVRYSLTFDVPSISGKTIGAGSSLALALWTSAGSNLNSDTDSLGIQSTTIDIWGVQVEEGTVANDFRRNANSLQGELAACQRYYFRPTGVSSGFIGGVGNAFSTTEAFIKFALPTSMRVIPTAVEFSPLALYDDLNVINITALTLNSNGTNQVAVVRATVASGLTTFRSYNIIAQGANLLAFSAEL
jgi:hypothetical protein